LESIDISCDADAIHLYTVIRSDQSAFLAFPDLLARLGHSFPGICQHRLSKGVDIEVENRPGDSDSDLKADLHAPHVHYIQCASDFANIGLFWAQIHFQRLGHIRRRVSGHLHCQSGGLYDHSRRVLRPEWRRRPAGSISIFEFRNGNSERYFFLHRLPYCVCLCPRRQLMSPKSHEPPFRFGTVSIVQHSHGGEHSPALQGDALPHAQLQSQRNQSRNLSCQTRVNILEVEMGMISIGRSPRKETQWNVQRRCGYVIFSKYFLVLHNCYIRRLSNCMVIRVEYAPILMSYFFINMKQPTIGRNS
jgi:hypothetical protein